MIFLSLLRVVIEIILASIAVTCYKIGADILCNLTNLYVWPIKLVGGCAVLASVYLVLEKLKEFLYFLFKSCTIWSLTHSEDRNNPFKAFKSILLNWQELIAVVTLNIAIRKALDALLSSQTFEEIPESIKKMENSKIGQLVKKVVLVTTDYADECVLAWCYSHDDKILSGCVNGIAIFIKNIAKLMIAAIPSMVLSSVLRGSLILFYVYQYIYSYGFSWETVVPAYICLLYLNKTVYVAIFEPFMMFNITRTYSKISDSVESMSDILAKLDSLDEISKIKSLITGGRKSDESTAEQCSDPEDV